MARGDKNNNAMFVVLTEKIIGGISGMKKKLCSCLLALLFVAGLVPNGALAAKAETTMATSNQQAKTRTARLDLRDMESTSNPAEGWTWDSENNILTLENINFVVGSDPSAIRMNSGTIVLKGTNRIICTYDDGKENKGISAVAVSGISAFNSSLVFEGTGSLDVSTTAYGGDGISTWHGSVTINSGDITATGGTSIRYNGCSSGVYTGALYMNGGTLKAAGKSSAGTSYGIHAYPKGIEITGGTIQASSGPSQNGTETDIPSTAIYADDIELNESVIQDPAGGKILTTKTPRTVMEYIASSNGMPATSVVISGNKPVETPLSPPVISLTTSNTIAEGESTAVTWNPVEGAVRYYITIVNKTAGIYLARDTIVNGTSYALYGPSLGEGTYEITVQVEGTNGQRSINSNTLLLTVEPDKSIEPAENAQFEYVQWLTRNSLTYADKQTKTAIQKSLYNLLFRAQYRPTHSLIKGDEMDFTGSLEVNMTWPIQNDQSGTTAYRKHIISDSVLGDVDIKESCAGCMAYGLFSSVYVYGSNGKAKTLNSLTADSVRDWIHTYADPGERMSFRRKGKTSSHAIVFLGEDDKQEGFYFISYNGGRSSSGADHSLYVDYYSYQYFVDSVASVFSIRDTNGGSYSSTKLSFTVPAHEMIETDQPVLGTSFSDVTSSDWYSNAVTYVFDNNIMTGTSATTFAPNATVERSQVVQMLYNLEGQPTVTGSSGFSDIKSDDWYSKAVTWAERNGVVDGYENNAFRPGKAVSREEFAQMLYNYSKYKRYDLSAAADLSEFPDGSSVSNWANSAVAWANGNGLINGHDDGRLDPSGTAIRAQAASILMGFDRKYVTE